MESRRGVQPLLYFCGSPAVFLPSCIEQGNSALAVHLHKVDITPVL